MTTTNATVTGDSSSGTMFIFTAPSTVSNYPGLNSEDAHFGTDGKTLTLPTGSTILQYGNTNFGVIPGTAGSSGVGSGSGTADITLTGVSTDNGAPATLSAYNGIVFWQDRGNSIMNYNADGTSQAPRKPSSRRPARKPWSLGPIFISPGSCISRAAPGWPIRPTPAAEAPIPLAPRTPDAWVGRDNPPNPSPMPASLPAANCKARCKSSPERSSIPAVVSI